MTREILLKNAKPILFNKDMVRAILDGRKTVTRRYKQQPADKVYHYKGYGENFWGEEKETSEGIYLSRINPPYQPEDILYVRESVFQGVGHYLDVSGETVSVLTHDFEYYADGQYEKDHWKDKYERTWMHRRPSIHMPKEAARIFLKVKDVRVERLQDITEEQVMSEGTESYCTQCDVYKFCGNTEPYKGCFGKLWNSTIKKSDLAKYGWDANPWVWVIEFERIEPVKDVN